MKEFIEKLIEKILNTPTNCLDSYSIISPDIITGVKNGIEYGCASRQQEIVDIVNQLAEEYNNGFCEWQPNKQFNWFLKSPHEGMGITQGEKGFFKFCPCCGKKIKVVE